MEIEPNIHELDHTDPRMLRNKMRVLPSVPATGYDALRQFLRQRAKGSDHSSRDWSKAGNDEQAAYRSGMWYAFHEVENWLDRHHSAEPCGGNPSASVTG